MDKDPKNALSPKGFSDELQNTWPVTLSTFGVLISDVFSYAAVAVRGVYAVREWQTQRRLSRVTGGDAEAAITELLNAETRGQSKVPPAAACQHLLLIVRAFGEAWGRCRSYGLVDSSIIPEAIHEPLTNKLAQQWSAVLAPDNPEPMAQFHYLARLCGDPLRSQFYHALWNALTDPSWEKPLLKLPEAKSAFEQFFRLAYHFGLNGPVGSEIQRLIDHLSEERSMALRMCIIQDMAGWGGRHVFGNVAYHDNLPDLPLSEMYVEPLASYQNQKAPILEILGKVIDKHNVIIVQADMGFGKSLTARHIAWRFAQDYLSCAQPTTEIPYPIFIKCAEDLNAGNAGDSDRIIRHALRRHARALGLNIKLNDRACTPLEQDKRVILLFDGLDEILLRGASLQALLEHLSEETSTEHKALIFTRPQVVPQKTITNLNIPVVEILPLSVHGIDNQAQEWLAKWNYLVRNPQNQSIIRLEEIEQLGMLDLAVTPILLFMIASVWDVLRSGSISRVMLYESFFRQLARGKHELDVKAKHHVIIDASDHLLEKLRSIGELSKDSTRLDAMLWLMARIAWKAECIKQKGDTLYTTDIETVIREELNLREDRDALRSICGGLLMALQADPEGDDASLLFGHRSFHEYMIGRFWASRLRRFIDARDEERTRLAKILLQGQLLSWHNQSLDFLVMIINSDSDSNQLNTQIGWTDIQRNSLIRCAQECFNDEKIVCIDDEKLSLRNDRWAPFRLAALAIGSLIKQGGIVANDHRTVRSLCCWYWLRNEVVPQLRASNSNLSGSDLGGADLNASEFRNTMLVGTNFTAAGLHGADLTRANLSGAYLTRAKADHSNFKHATLCGAHLEEASFEQSDFSFADMRNATLFKVNLREANLYQANLEGALMEEATMSQACLNAANLRRARLSKSDLRGASLKNTSLAESDLRMALLDDADLCHSDLRGAQLSHASLKRTKLSGAHKSEPAIYDCSTVWPDGFDPISAGALRIDIDIEQEPSTVS